MKGPKKRLSNAEYSSMVALSCMAIGAIILGVITTTTINSILGKVLSVVGWLIVSGFFVYAVIYQLKRIKEEEDEEK